MAGAADGLGPWPMPTGSAIPEVDDRFSWFDYRSRGFERDRVADCVSICCWRPPACSHGCATAVLPTTYRARWRSLLIIARYGRFRLIVAWVCPVDRLQRCSGC